MKIRNNDQLYALADPLDHVEGEILGATVDHSRRVAYLAVKMGKLMGYENKELLNLAASAVLHDNALTEYSQSELNKGIDIINDKNAFTLKEHCVMGEENVRSLPFYKDKEAAQSILYHHEEADGSGPFGLKAENTPMFAQLIHIADVVDVIFDISQMNYTKYGKILEFVNAGRDSRFAGDVADAFCAVATYGELSRMDNDYIDKLLRRALPVIPVDYTDEDLAGIAAMFAKIIDYKSSFTCAHSLGVANKAKTLAQYYGLSEETVARIYFAGALHDIGKLTIDNDILEKPAKLTDGEFTQMKNHAYGTWEILGRIKGVGSIRDWAALHHEKLDGSGYPFGIEGRQLNKIERMMACVDIYQALTEARPYKDGMSHEATMAIMRKEVARGKLDGGIVEDMDRCLGGDATQKAS